MGCKLCAFFFGTVLLLEIISGATLLVLGPDRLNISISLIKK